MQDSLDITPIIAILILLLSNDSFALFFLLLLYINYLFNILSILFLASRVLIFVLDSFRCSLTKPLVYLQ